MFILTMPHGDVICVSVSARLSGWKEEAFSLCDSRRQNHIKGWRVM